MWGSTLKICKYPMPHQTYNWFILSSYQCRLMVFYFFQWIVTLIYFDAVWPLGGSRSSWLLCPEYVSLLSLQYFVCLSSIFYPYISIITSTSVSISESSPIGRSPGAPDADGERHD